MVPPPGRPRDPQVDVRILDIAVELLLQHGYRDFNIDELATRAKIAKTTLYRRWPTKDHLALAVVARMQDIVDITSTGDIAADLTRYLTHIAAGLNTMRRAGNATAHDPRSGGNVAEITAAIARHADLGELNRAQFAKRNAQAIELITRARDTGQLAPATDPAVLFDQLAGAVYYRVLITGEPVDPAYIHTLVTNALSGIRTPKGNPS